MDRPPLRLAHYYPGGGERFLCGLDARPFPIRRAHPDQPRCVVCLELSGEPLPVAAETAVDSPAEAPR